MMLAQSTLKEIAKLPGIADLPTNVRLSIAKALIAELGGDNLVAEEELNRAVQIEEGLRRAEESQH